MEELEQNKQMRFDWLRSEQDFANSSISDYSESDRKIISIISTVIVALLGISASKHGIEDERKMPYMLFLASGLLSLAVIMSVFYSALTLSFRKRKLILNKRMAEFLSCDEDFTSNKNSLSNRSMGGSYYWSLRAYDIFKCIGPLALTLSGLLYPSDAKIESLFLLALTASSLMAISSLLVMIAHIVEFNGFWEKLRDKTAV